LNLGVAKIFKEFAVDGLTELLHAEVVVRVLEEGRPFFRALLIGISANLKLSYIFKILLVLNRVRVYLCLNLVQLFDTAEFNASSLCLIQEDGLGIGES
jgi:hypothetical protein